MCYRGQFDCLVTLLNLERMFLKKVMYDQLSKEKSRFRMKTMEIKHGELLKTVSHDADTIKRHREFDLRLAGRWSRLRDWSAQAEPVVAESVRSVFGVGDADMPDEETAPKRGKAAKADVTEYFEKMGYHVEGTAKASLKGLPPFRPALPSSAK